MDCVLGHPSMTTKGAEHASTSVGTTYLCGRHSLKRRQTQVALSQLYQKHACDAGRSLVGVQHNLLTRLGVRRGIVPPALAARILEVVPLFIVPSFFSDPQPIICRNALTEPCRKMSH